ncbi:MAG: pyridoxamine 5'-phosphate oxidase [Planctomycetota bacterium]
MESQALDFEHPPPDPVAQLLLWLEEATQRTGLPNPNAMTVATVDPDGRPSARIVLLKHLDEHGAVFFTNYGSRKGHALEANPRAALVLHWDVLERQVRIEGPVERADDELSDAYFATRRRRSQLGASVSPQSRLLQSRDALLREVEALDERLEGKAVPRPPHWGGYRVILERVEFWQGRSDRLHDRLVFEREADRWQIHRLAP